MTSHILAMALMASSAAAPVEWLVTAYCGCPICTGDNSPAVGGKGLTTSEEHPVRGATIAAPRGIPLGTVLCLEGYGVRVVQDRGGSIRGRHLDIYTRDPRDPEGHYELSHRKALERGAHRVRVWVVQPYDSAGVVACEEGAR